MEVLVDARRICSGVTPVCRPISRNTSRCTGSIITLNGDFGDTFVSLCLLTLRVCHITGAKRPASSMDLRDKMRAVFAQAVPGCGAGTPKARELGTHVDAVVSRTRSLDLGWREISRASTADCSLVGWLGDILHESAKNSHARRSPIASIDWPSLELLAVRGLPIESAFRARAQLSARSSPVPYCAT